MSNQDTIAAWLKARGASAVQAAGVLGNFQVESGFDPTARNAAEGAVGIAQWEGGRETNLANYARSHGTSETDLATQLGFLGTELDGPEKSAWTALLQTTSASAAATVWDQKFERSSSASLPTRVAAAEKIAGGGSSWWDSVTHAVTDPVGAATDAVGGAFGSVFGGWENDLTNVGLKVLAGSTAATLVIVGAWQSFRNDRSS